MILEQHCYFLHSNVLYNNIKFVFGDHKKNWGGRNRIDPEKHFK